MTDRRRLWIVAVALLGVFPGALGGFWVGRAVLMRTASRNLADFARFLALNGRSYALETSEAWRALAASPAGFCSPRDIATMRDVVFHSLEIKDIARSRDGKIYCSAVAGQLAKPLPTPSSFMVLPNGAKLFEGAPFASAEHGTFIELGGVAVLTSPIAYNYWARPPMRYAVYLTNPSVKQVKRIAGEELGVDPAAVLAETEGSGPSGLYAVFCDHTDHICVLAAEDLPNVLSGAQPGLNGYLAIGALGGFSLSLVLGLAFLRHEVIDKQLRRAIRKGKLHLVYHPILDLPSRRIVGAEALVRWNRPGHGPVSPEFFVCIAEKSGYVHELTAFVFQRAMEELQDLLRENPGFTLCINVAASDLTHEELYSVLEVHVRQKRIRPEQVALELTERSTAELAAVGKAIARLHRLGHRIYIDDFGTGFSSLSYLQELEADVIKIDRAFTRVCGTNAVTASILPQILAMVEFLHIGVIVEGVETEAQANYLESTGIPMCAQGWYFSRELPAEGLIETLRRTRMQDAQPEPPQR